VAETAVSGWDLTSATCSDGSPITAIVVSAGETVTCTFTNTKRGRIEVEKQTLPDGSVATFGFTGDISATLSDGGSSGTNVAPGNYSVVESAKTGWSLTSIVCNDSDSSGNTGTRTASFVVAAGETVRCVFTNTQLSQLRIRKVTVPSGLSDLFTFTPASWNSGNTFQLSDGQTMASGFLSPGASYSATETVPSTFALTNRACVLSGTATPHTFTSINSDTGVSVTLAPGEDVTCTFTNSRLPTLILEKYIHGESTLFSFTVSGVPANPPNTSISLTPPTDGSVQSSSQVIQLGDYTVTEVSIPNNWLLTDGSCVSDQPAGFVTSNAGLPAVTFTARYGDNVVCTFVDNQLGGATRTQGFWATHTALANAIWNGTALPPGTGDITPVPVIGSADAYLCQPPNPSATPTPYPGVPITATPSPGQNQMMGGFWANIANKTTGSPKKRGDLDKARMQFLQQYLAAVLNFHAFQTPIPGTSLADARAAYCGTNISLIHDQMVLLAAYNTSGDTVVFTPGSSATPTESKIQANVAFWDVTFHGPEFDITGGLETRVQVSPPVERMIIVNSKDGPPAVDPPEDIAPVKKSIIINRKLREK
jgi:hypothetical protein